MSRSNRQIFYLFQMLVRGVRSGKIKLWWLVAVGLLAVGYFLLQPVLVKSLGVNLPGLSDLVASSTKTGNTAGNTADTAAKTAGKTPDKTAKTAANTTTKTAKRASTSAKPKSGSSSDDLLAQILAGNSRQVYTSSAGLRYTRGSAQGHRLKHLMAHAVDEPNRPGQHGVFDNDDPSAVVALVDEAYLQAQAGRDTRTQNEDERIVYDVNLRRRIGYVGGQSGNRRNRPTAKHLRIVVEGDRLITAFPIKP